MSNGILGIFAASPFKAIKSHMAKVFDGVSALGPTIDAALQQNWDLAAQHQQVVIRCEEEADTLKRGMRLHLPNSLFMPVPRQDLLELLSVQDKIANQSKKIAALFMERHLLLPKDLVSLFQQLLNVSIAACIQAKKAVDKLDELVETGFKGHVVKTVEDMIQTLDKIEHDSDCLQSQVQALLFVCEKEYDPVDVLFFYKSIDLTAMLANRAQRVGHRLQLLLAR
jgi:uncharacterized protein